MEEASVKVTALCSLVLLILLRASSGTAFAAETKPETTLDPKPNPDWCHPRFRCLTIEDYAEMTVIKLNLAEALRKEKTRARHFGFGCTIGPGIATVVDPDYHVHLVPSNLTIACGATVKF